MTETYLLLLCLTSAHPWWAGRIVGYSLLLPPIEKNKGADGLLLAILIKVRSIPELFELAHLFRPLLWSHNVKMLWRQKSRSWSHTGRGTSCLVTYNTVLTPPPLPLCSCSNAAVVVPFLHHCSWRTTANRYHHVAFIVVTFLHRCHHVAITGF